MCIRDSLNAEDERTLIPLEAAIDLALLDQNSDIAVLRGETVKHPKYLGLRTFGAGINLTHLYQGQISFLWYIKRDMGAVNKVFRGLASPYYGPEESLFPLKENAPTSPKLPVGIPLYWLPRDSAASSIIGIFQRLQTLINSFK